MLGFQSSGSMNHVNINSNFASSSVKHLYTCSWLPICREMDVTDKKVYNLDLIDLSVTVTRLGDGSYSVFDDRCPHRGAKLSGGTLDSKGYIQCPYHGMKFDCKTSRIVEFLETDDVSKIKGSLKSYKTRVYDNLVWAYMGDPDMEPVFHADELKIIPSGDTLDFVSNYGHCDIDCSLFDVEENLLDNIHISYVHSFGNRMDPNPINVIKFPEDRGNHFFYKFGEKSFANLLDISGEDMLSVYNSFREPCSAMSRVSFGESLVKTVRVHLLPLGENKTRVFWGIHRNFLTAYILDQVFEYFMLQTLSEDKLILENLYKPGVPVKQMLTEYDWLIIQYRKRMATHMCTK